jgi:hypothetical protein
VQVQLTHVRQSIAALQSCIRSDDNVGAAEQQRAAATRECNACAQKLMDVSRTLKQLLVDRVASLEAEIAAQERCIAHSGNMDGADMSSDETQALKVSLLRALAACTAFCGVNLCARTRSGYTCNGTRRHCRYQ